jgi:hypothetical protein
MGKPNHVSLNGTSNTKPESTSNGGRLHSGASADTPRTYAIRGGVMVFY